MRIQIAFAALIFACISCQSEEASRATNEQENPTKDPIKTIHSSFGKILADHKLEGSILIKNEAENAFLSNDFGWADSEHLPASTFKIVNSIVGLETGVLEDQNHVFHYNGEERSLAIWEKNLSLKEAFQASCVPCYQELAREIGAERMQTQLAKLQFGSMDVSEENIDVFWLRGNSTISQFQQIDFLERLYDQQLPIKPKTDEIIKSIMIVEEGEDYLLRGKTGWAINGTENTGWFVGYVERKDHVFFFATHVKPLPDFDMADFPAVRQKVTRLALAELGILEEKGENKL